MSRGSLSTVLQRVIVLAFPLLIFCVLGVREVRRNSGETRDRSRIVPGTEAGLGRSIKVEQGGPRGSEVSPLTLLKSGRAGREGAQPELVKLVDGDGSSPSSGAEILARLGRKERLELGSYLKQLSSSEGKERPWLCWGQEVSPAKLAAYHEVEKRAGLAGGGYEVAANQFQSSGRWSETATDGFDLGGQGDASTLTWSIVPDGTTTPGLTNQSGTGSNFRAWMASIYGGSVSEPAAGQVWFAIFEKAFEEMAETCGVTLVYEAMDDGVPVDSSNPGELGVRGDLRIAARVLDGNSGNLAIAFPPDHGDMIFDSGDGTFEITSGDSIRLFNTVTHELGHSLGLAHVCPINQTKLLEPSLTISFQGPQFDEFQSLQRLYGDRFEVHGEFRDNDTAEAAKVIELAESLPVAFPRLSIDDDRDRDFYRFEGVVGQRLNVELIPGEGNYLEGGQSGSGCTQGINFDSTAVHDLSVQVLAGDGETVVFEADLGGVGEREVIEQFELPASGAFYLRVDGDLSNAAQLYELRAELLARLPAPRLRLVEHRVEEESGSVKNGRLDPGETIRLEIEIENEGELPSGTLTTNLLLAGNAVIFSESAPLHLSPGESGVVEVVLASTGECGDLVELALAVEDSSGELLGESLELEAGVVTRPVAFDVDFEELDDLPPAWTSEASGSGEEWSLASSRSDSRLQSAFAPGSDSIGEAALLTPVFELAPGGGTLGFRHLYRLEAGFDGGVLEVSRNGGAWRDLITDPEVVVSGGYNRGIRDGFGSAIAGQLAWSGIEEVSAAVSVELPATWAGEMIQFRWRVVHDSSSAREGWWIDEVRMEMLVEDCESHRPELSLALASGSLDENHPDASAVLKVQAILPLASPLEIPLEISGSATLSEDFGVDLPAILPAGEASIEIPVTVISDQLAEGDETVVIAIPSDHPDFITGDSSAVSLTISDLWTIESWSTAFFGAAVDLLGDSDGDGFDELAEYLLGTDPGLASDGPSLSLLASEGKFLLPLGPLPLRVDASLGIEFSSDLESWETGELKRVPQGLEITPMSGKGYFRLTFSLD